MPPVQNGEQNTLSRKVWFHGFTYNATPGSRAALTSVANDTIKNGHTFCFDPEAYIDRASLPSGMSQMGKPNSPSGPFMNVCKPTTAVLSRFAGTVVGLPPEGLRPDLEPAFGGYKGGCWLELEYDGPSNALQLGDCSAGYGVLLAPVDGQWYLSPIAVGTNGANIPLVCAKPGHVENLASAAIRSAFLRQA
jgi:hypothetical protein